MQARFARMYTVITTMTMPVATSRNAVIGSQVKPSARVAPIAIANCAATATTGDRWRGCSRANWRGKTPTRAIAYAVRVETVRPALAFAIVELTIAKNTRTQN